MLKNSSKEEFYRQAANNFANSALIRRQTAVVHVEGETDVSFWRHIFTKFYPKGKFHFVYYSKSAAGVNSSGSTQCLNYQPYLSERFFVCIDSDNKYLLQENTLSIKDFVFQTYTYSIENHYCYAPHLCNTCSMIIKDPYGGFDFNKFLRKYSNIIYELLIWHIFLLKRQSSELDVIPFNNIISYKGKITYWQLEDNGRFILDKIKMHVNTRLKALERKYQNADIESESKRCEQLGLTKNNAYLFIRGHHLFNFMTRMGQMYCDTYYRNMRNRPPKHKREFKTIITEDLMFGNYFCMNKIEEDITSFFNNKK